MRNLFSFNVSYNLRVVSSTHKWRRSFLEREDQLMGDFLILIGGTALTLKNDKWSWLNDILSHVFVHSMHETQVATSPLVDQGHSDL